MTPIGAYNRAQIEYRLGGGNGCSERQFDYRILGQERPLRWIGSGLSEVGIEAGSVLTDDQRDWARALMAGVDPQTGEQLVTPKLAVYRDAKVPLAPLVAAVRSKLQRERLEAKAVFTNDKMLASYVAAERAVEASGEGALRRADEAGQLADAANLNIADVWGEQEYAAAVANLSTTVIETDDEGNRAERVVPRRRSVGNAGYDVTFTIPKSMSLLLAFAGEGQAERVEGIYSSQVGRAFGWMESQTAYGMRGKHGGGKSASVTAGTGFLGWAMTHRAARPVGDADVGDPHWHVHVTLANMTRSAEDGRWSTVAAGGRDLMRHAPSVGRILRALTRHELGTQLGVKFDRSARTEAWEIAGIPDSTLRHFSKRGESIHELLAQLGMDEGRVSVEAERIAEAQTRGAKTEVAHGSDATLRMVWLADAERAGIDVEEMMRHVNTASGRTVLPADLRRHLVAVLSDPETGLTAHSRRFSKLDLMGAIAESLPGGIQSIEALDGLADQLLLDPEFVDLRMSVKAERGMNHSHLANAQLYTTRDVIAAERAIFAHAVESDARYAAVAPEVAVDAMLTVEATQGYPLSDEQREAVGRVVTSERAVDTVLGPPGTGKTTIMRAARTAWEARGFRVLGVATAAVAAHHMAVEAGLQTRTVAGVLMAPDRLGEVDVLVVDEANLTDDRSRAALYAAAATHNVKVVEVGDPKQLRGVGCGSLFGKVHEVVAGSVLSENRRQLDEVERRALQAWRDGDYQTAWRSWADRGRLVATETVDEAVADMVVEGIRLRSGAPDVHDAIHGVVMIAGTRAQVDLLNRATQTVRAEQGHVWDTRTYAGALGAELRFGVHDQVMIRVNSRRQRLHVGEDVLNGYRGVVTATRADGVDVEWRQPGPDGDEVRTATLPVDYIAGGGLELGYAITAHKAEGLTVKADWTTADGEPVRGAVLVNLHGMDNPAMYVSASRHKDKVIGYAARQLVESVSEQDERGVPESDAERRDRVAGAVAAIAARTATNRNDEPVTEQPDGRPRTDHTGLTERLAALRRRSQEHLHDEAERDREESGPRPGDLQREREYERER